MLTENDLPNESLDCPSPAAVYCIGRGEEAAVWWVPRDDVEGGLGDITAWQVLRYRRDPCPPYEWRIKGTIQTSSQFVTHTIVSGLSSGFEYRFTVRSTSGLQVGPESAPSNACLVEHPLPSGWFRFRVPEAELEIGATVYPSTATATEKPINRMFYYANIKTKETSWSRPETGRYFLEEAIYMRFSQKEHVFLKSLFDEEIANVGHLTIDGCRDMLLEAGEKLTRKQLAILFRAYTGSDTELHEFQQFMGICVYAKDHNHQRTLTVLQSLVNATRRSILRNVDKISKVIIGEKNQMNVPVLSTPQERLGKWKMRFNELADRNYYVHSETGATSWELPEEVRFYVEPKSLLPKIVSLLEFNNFDIVVKMFSEVNVDCSGSITERELNMILNKIGIFLPISEVHMLFLDRDVDRLDKLAFNEVIDLLVSLLSRNDKELVPDVLKALGDLSAGREASIDGDSNSIGYFSQEDDVSSEISESTLNSRKRKVKFNQKLEFRSEVIVEEGDEPENGDEGPSKTERATRRPDLPFQNFIQWLLPRKKRPSAFQEREELNGVSCEADDQTETKAGTGRCVPMRRANRYKIAPHDSNILEDPDELVDAEYRGHKEKGASRSGNRKNVKRSVLVTDVHDLYCMCGCRRIVELHSSSS